MMIVSVDSANIAEADSDAIYTHTTNTRDMFEEMAYNPTEIHILSERNFTATGCTVS